MSCKNPEPPPHRFYAPAGTWVGEEWLGSSINSPGYSFQYEVATGPLCRVYYSPDGRIEPHALESAWQKINGKWQKLHPNYLSYRIKNGEFITVRWRNPNVKN